MVTIAKQVMINSDPYADVRMHRIEHNGKPTDKYMVEMVDADGAWQPMPGVNAVHGEDYTLVPNTQVHELVGDVLTRTGRTFKPVPTFGNGHSKPLHWDGKRWSEKWYCEEVAEAMPTGHALALGVEAINSYDGTHNVGIRFFAMHCLCANQFYAGNMMGNFVFRHMSRDAGIRLQDNVEDALKLMRQQADQFLRIVPQFKKLCDVSVRGMDGFLDLRSALNADVWRASRDPDVLDELYGAGITKELGMRQMDPRPECMWNILNAYTAVSTHKIGGFNGSSASERVTSKILEESDRLAAAGAK